jgi:DNA polymerase-3 subunit epsilon
MGYILGFDTETTGLPVWKEPSGSENQPHLVQLAAALCDEVTGNVVSSMDVIIKPDGWVIPQEVIDIHGITNEMAMDVGIDEEQALGMFLSLCGDHKRVAHNRTFDQRIIRIACKRYATDQVIEKWADKDNFDCSMWMAKKIMKDLPNAGGGSLASAYQFFTGKELEGAHNAMVDTKACMEIYFAIKNGDYLK